MPARKRCVVCGKMTEKFQRINGGPWHCYDGCKSTTGRDHRKRPVGYRTMPKEQKEVTATEKDVKSKWDGFRCSLCWHPFAVGDKYRWVYMNGASPSPGNFLVCDLCDEPDIAEKVRAVLRSGSDMLNMDSWALVYRYQELYKQFEALAAKEKST